MGLGIYTSTVPSAKLSQGDFSKPLAASFDGRAGGSTEIKLYVRNDNAVYYYTTLSVTSVDLGGLNIVNGSAGYSWKLVADDPQPSQATWDATAAANTITLPNIGSVGIGDTSTYLPFWLRIEVPKNSSVNTFTDVQLKITATQFTV